MDENINKKAQILFKKEKPKRIISHEKRKNSKENITSKITNNTSNNTYLNSNNSTSGIKLIKIKNKKDINGSENTKNYSPRIPKSGPVKKKVNEIPDRKKEKNQKNYRKEKLQKLGLNDGNNKIMKKNKSFNQKKPKSISTDNNIFNCDVKKKEDINKNKINIPNNNKIKYNNYLKDNNNNDNNKLTSKQNGSYTKINKNKVNAICTYENQKKNTSLLIRNKTNENYNKSKENKSNISNYDKRKNYNVPKCKAKPRKNENQEKEDINVQNENDDEAENEKEKNISKLLQNQEASYIKEFKKLMEEGTQSKKIKDFEIKRKLIEGDGIDFENFCMDYEKEEKEENDNNIEEEIKKIKNKTKEKKYKEKKNNKNITLEINENNMKKNEKIKSKEKKEKHINNENRNMSNENKYRINKDKIKANINRNNINNLIMQNNSNNTNNSSNNNYLLLQNENINMNLSGSSEKINNKEKNNDIINKYNQFNIKQNNFEYYEKMEQFPSIKEKRKQVVNTFEFFEKIINKMDNPIEIKDKNKKEYFDENIQNNDSLGESFRKSINNTKNEEAKNNVKNFKKIKNNSHPKKIMGKNEKEQDIISETEADSGFNYNSKKNTRSKPEIMEFMEKKKKMDKLKEQKNLKNTQAKKLNKYLGLYKLQEGINLNVSKNRSKIYSIRNNSNMKNKKEINENKNNREKMPNEYYLGKNLLKRKNSDISKSTESSQSTILDENNYYLNLIESKNILSSNYNPDLIEKKNHILENINNNDVNNNLNNNFDNSNNIRITTKDKDVQNTYNMNTNTSNNRISQEMNEKQNYNMLNDNKNKVINGDLFVKCKETLEKANHLFSKSNIDEYINNYKTTYDDKNKEEINNIYNNEEIDENKNYDNGDIEENNQIINTQINKSESKQDKSINDEIFQNNENNNEEIQENIINNRNENININENQNIIKNNIQEFNLSDLNYKNGINLQNENKINDNNIHNDKKQIINQNKDDNYINYQQIINESENNNEDIKDIFDNKKTYFFSQEDLENYYKIFISLDDYLNSLTKKNALNDIISYGDLKYTYRIGFEHLILLLKSYPFNLLRLIYQRQYYKDVLRQFFVPYLRRAFNNINIYTYNKQRFSEVNRAIEQIYRIVFLKRLIFYGQIKSLNIENKIQNKINNANSNSDDKSLPLNKNIVINIENINNNNNKEKEKEKSIKYNKEKIEIFVKILQLIYKKFILSKLYYYINIENLDKKNENEPSDKSNFSSQRYNTYIYESFSEKSSLTAYPNSEGSARLHKVCELLEMQRKPQLEDENNNLSEIANDSIQSLKSLDDNKNKKKNIEENRINPNINNNNLINKKKEEKNLKENLIQNNLDTNKETQNEIKKMEISESQKTNNLKEKEIKEEDGLNIPYKEIMNNLKNKEKNIENIINNNEKEVFNVFKNDEKNKNDINNLITYENKEEKNDKNKDNEENNLNVKYENLPRKIENEQYKKIEIVNDNSKSSNKYTGCIKKIEISNNLKINKNSQHTSEDISASKESNLIDWEFNNTNSYVNNKSSNRDKSPLVNDLLNSKKDDLLNSSEFNSNIKEGIIEENDININNENEKVNENKNNINNAVENKETLELNEKKSRNNINEIKNDLKEININNDNNNKQINNTNDIIKNTAENNYQVNLILSNSVKNNNLNPELNNNISNSNNANNLRYNENIEVTETNINKECLKEKNIKIINEKDEKKYKIFSKLSDDLIQKISENLSEDIISSLLSSEIKDKKKSLFKKKKEINASLNNSSASLIVSQNSMSIGSHSPGRNYPSNKNGNLVNNNDSYQTISSVNNSQSEAILNNSIFMRTLDEIKKEKILNLYNDKIAPSLIDKIENNIEKNYENIINNLKIPLRIDEAKMINGLMLKDRSLSISSKIRFCNENITQVKFVEEKILKDFEIVDKEIRSNDNIINDNYYDKILNKCIYDTTNELIEKQRKYGIIGEPLFWSIRTKDIDYKYKNKDKYSKTIFINKIIKEMKKIIDTKMGLIAENYEYLDMDQLNQDRDKKFMESITSELKDNEDYYQIFETQETYVKLSLSRIIMDQLLNEIVEILEHVQYSRKEPDKYQSKSIYACEDIPRLSFQPQTMENNYSGNLEGDGEGDESINQ